MSNLDEPDDLPEIVSSSFEAFGPAVKDEIRPTAMRHEVDEITADGELLQRYNYIEYEFEMDGKYCRARAYVDEVTAVAFFGPFAGKTDLRPIPAPDFQDKVLDYLKRRFDRISELEENGYVTVWTRPV